MRRRELGTAAERERRRGSSLWPFAAGALAGAAGALLATRLVSRPAFDPGLVDLPRDHPDVPDTILIPGVLGSRLLRPDGTEAWLNLGNVFGHHELALPLTLPLSESRDDLVPAGLVGAGRVIPRLFGFSEYSDIVQLLRSAGFRGGPGAGPRYHLFAYDWRRDLAEAARALHDAVETLAERSGNPDLRVNIVAHSMGGLIARCYLRYGDAEITEDAPITWAGAKRIHRLLVVTCPSAGSVPSLEALLSGARVGFSATTLAASVTEAMPAMYQLLPTPGTVSLLDESGRDLDVDLMDPATWERFGWGPWRDGEGTHNGIGQGVDPEIRQAFVTEALRRASLLHCALSRVPAIACPVRAIAFGGDCMPTLARAIVPDRRGQSPRFEPRTRAQARLMYEAGDGRVTRASLLGSHLPWAHNSEIGSGFPEIASAFLGSADHHGIYAEPTFQSAILRQLLRPARPALRVVFRRPY
jgi:pimeloyl-ACP methyl ester carboxylesterase